MYADSDGLDDMTCPYCGAALASPSTCDACEPQTYQCPDCGETNIDGHARRRCGVRW